MQVYYLDILYNNENTLVHCVCLRYNILRAGNINTLTLSVWGTIHCLLSHLP